jgi:hypothetical protein
MTLLRRRRPTNSACTNCKHGRGPWLTLCVKTQLHAVPFCNVATKKCTSGPSQPMCWSLLGSARKAVRGFFFSPSVFIHARYTAYPELFGLSSNPNTIVRARLLTPSPANTTSPTTLSPFTTTPASSSVSKYSWTLEPRRMSTPMSSAWFQTTSWISPRWPLKRLP